MRRNIIQCVLIGIILFAGVGGLAAPRKMSLSEAVVLALKQNLEIEISREKVGEAEAHRRAARGNLGPKLSVEANIFRWDDEVSFAMSEPGPDVMQKHAAVFMKYGDLMQALPDLFDFGAIREQTTSQITMTATQPITPMYPIIKGYKIAGLNRDATRLDLNSTRDAIIYKVTRAYIGLKQVSSAVEIARGAVEQVQAHLQQVQIFHRSGLIGRNDVLKVELALAQGKERLIKVRAGMAMSQSALAMELGLSPKENIMPIERFSDPPPPFSQSLEICVQAGLKQRPELRALTKRVSMADIGRDIARWALVPEVAALASYQHSEGMGMFMPKDAFFVGGVLKWDFWEWGAKYYAIGEAGHKVRQSQFGLKQLRNGIYLDVKKSYLDLRTAEQTLAVARSAVIQAKENFRIVQAKFEGNANTSTDVLDAQMALTRAQLSYTTAIHGWYMARAALFKATGGWNKTYSSNRISISEDSK